jgi:flagellar biosynthesis/type III secretory pathway M-ring protein FliF/YscJ
VFGAAMFLRRRKGSHAAELTGPAALHSPEGQAARAGLSAGPGLEQQMASQLAERDAQQHKLEAQALNSLKMAPVITKKAEVFAKHLREKIKTEPEVSAQILRTWIREEES